VRDIDRVCGFTSPSLTGHTEYSVQEPMIIVCIARWLLSYPQTTELTFNDARFVTPYQAQEASRWLGGRKQVVTQREGKIRLLNGLDLCFLHRYSVLGTYGVSVQ
jgi:hypothetical protein